MQPDAEPGKLAANARPENEVADRLEQAVNELHRARVQAMEELSSEIESVIEHSYATLDGARNSGAERASEWQRTLEEATDEVNRKAKVLREITAYLREHKAELTGGGSDAP